MNPSSKPITLGDAIAAYGEQISLDMGNGYTAMVKLSTVTQGLVFVIDHPTGVLQTIHIAPGALDTMLTLLCKAEEVLNANSQPQPQPQPQTTQQRPRAGFINRVFSYLLNSPAL